MRGENNVITLRGPKHAQFANEDTRLLTFRDWPQAMPQRPKDLAEAGFFYLGMALPLQNSEVTIVLYTFIGCGDFAQCFYCGGGLKNWDPNDTPWQEHARWFPKCAFVQLVKGKSFVEAAKPSRPIPNDDREDPSESTSDEHSKKKTQECGQMPSVNPKTTNGLPVRAESDPTELLKENARLRDERLCRICYDREANIVFVPCGHLATCGNCASAFSDCPVCRTPIQTAVKTFMA